MVAWENLGNVFHTVGRTMPTSTYPAADPLQAQKALHFTNHLPAASNSPSQATNQLAFGLTITPKTPALAASLKAQRLPRPGKGTLRVSDMPAISTLVFAGNSNAYNYNEFITQALYADSKETWDMAVNLAVAHHCPDVTPAAYLASMITQFQQDVEGLRTDLTEENKQGFCGTFLGQAVFGNLVNPLTQETLDDAEHIIDELGAISEECIAQLDENQGTAEISTRDMRPSTELNHMFQVAHTLHEGRATQGNINRLDNDEMFWILQQMGGPRLAPLMKRMLRLKLNGRNILSEQQNTRLIRDIEVAVTQQGMSSTQQGLAAQNLTQKTKLAGFVPYPLNPKDLEKTLALINRRPHKNIQVIVPPQYNTGRVVETLSHQLQTLDDTSTPLVIQLDLDQIRQNSVKALIQDQVAQITPPILMGEIVKQLKDTIAEQVDEHPGTRLLIHMNNPSGIIDILPADRFKQLLEHLNKSGPVQLLFTPSLDFLRRHLQATGQSSLDGLYTKNFFHTQTLYWAPIEETLEYLKTKILPTMEEDLADGPELTDEGLQKVVEIASVFRGEEIVRKSEEILHLAVAYAKREGKTKLTSDIAEEAIRNTPGMYFSVHALTAGQAQILAPTELALKLKEEPSLVTPQNLERVFEQVLDAIEHPDVLRQKGIKRIPRVMLIAGPSGTAKTQLIYQFASHNGLNLINFSGREFEFADDATINQEVQRAFEEANMLSRGQTDKPVVVLLDNMEATSGRQNGNPIFAPLLAQLTELKANPNANILVFLVTNSNNGIFPRLLQEQDPLVDLSAIIEAPDVITRRAIMKNLMEYRKQQYPKLFAEGINTDKYARMLSGYTGRQLGKFIDDAIEIQHYDPGDTTQVTEEHFSRALRKMMMGGEENLEFRDAIRGKQIQMTAYHEVAHALTSWFTNKYFNDPSSAVEHITVIPQGNARGVTFYRSTEDYTKMVKSQIIANLISSVAGGAIERIRFGDTGLGVSGDQNSITNMLVALVGKLGIMGGNTIVFNEAKPHELPEAVYQEMNRISHTTAHASDTILKAYMPFIETIAERLVGPDGLDGEWVMEGDEFVQLANAWDEQDNHQTHNAVKAELDEILHPVIPEYFGDPLYPAPKKMPTIIRWLTQRWTK